MISVTKHNDKHNVKQP